MRRKKCLATLTMAAMVAASLAGCSSSGEKTDNSQAAVSGETTVSDSGENVAYVERQRGRGISDGN